jgi:hemolysin activation/secretion protein
MKIDCSNCQLSTNPGIDLKTAKCSNLLRLRFATLLTASLQITAAWAIGGAESMDRPSEYRPPLPEYKPKQSPEGFVLPPVPEKPPAIAKDSRKFFIKRIVVDGNTVIPEEDLLPLVKPFEGREVTIAELEELRQKITQLYIDRGYINSGAIIPEDALKKDEIHYRIIEGRLDEVRVKGQGRLREGYIQNRLQGDPETPLNQHELEDRFQLLLSDPLISKMNGRILPGASPGHGILDVDVVRARPYHLSLFGDNFRPPSIGAEAFGLTGYLNNLTGLGDTLDFTFITSSGSNRYSGGFNLPLTDYGTLAFFRFDEGDTVVVESPFQDLDIESEVHILEGGISHPIINTFNRRLNLGVLLTTRENETSLLGRPFSFVEGVPSNTNQATVWRIFQDFIQRWERNAFAFRSTFSVGMDALGATPARDDLPSSEFFAWLGQLQYAYLVDGEGTQLILRGNVQVADSKLLPLEQIAIGGVSTVRGYRTNYLVRDEGYNLSLELRYPLLSFTTFEKQNRITLVPFVDYGEAWNRGKHSDALVSVGAGFSWQLESFLAEFYYGYALKKPLGQQSGDLQDDGIYFQVKWDVF